MTIIKFYQWARGNSKQRINLFWPVTFILCYLKTEHFENVTSLSMVFNVVCTFYWLKWIVQFDLKTVVCHCGKLTWYICWNLDLFQSEDIYFVLYCFFWHCCCIIYQVSKSYQVRNGCLSTLEAEALMCEETYYFIKLSQNPVFTGKGLRNCNDVGWFIGFQFPLILLLPMLHAH